VRATGRTVALAATVALLGCPTAIAGQAGGHAVAGKRAANRYQTGIGEQQPELFADPLWRQLHTRIVRYIVPFDAAVRPYWLAKAGVWIRAAEARHQQIVVAFYHSEVTPLKMPSVATYQSDVGKFVRLFPKVRQYQSWNEANRGNVAHMFSSPSAASAAMYYQALIRVCGRCSAVGLDVLDSAKVASTLRYVTAFKREISRLKTVMPRIWGLHNYSDINRLESRRTRELVHAFGGEVWLTETGGIVKFGKSFPNRQGAGLRRAAKVLAYMFGVAGSEPQIKRLYIYNWTGGTSSTRFDAGLMNARAQPRLGYVAVCRHLRAANCNVKVVEN
jgi:hypothetical protein